MREDYLKTAIAKHKKGIATIFLVFAAISCLFPTLMLGGKVGVLKDPYITVNSAADIKGHYFVQDLNASKVYDLGYDYQEDGKVIGHYGVITLADSYLIVRFPNANGDLIYADNVQLSGKLMPLVDFEKDMLDDYVDMWKAEDPTVDTAAERALFAPYRLDYGISPQKDIVPATIFFGIGGVLLAIGVFVYATSGNYKSSKAYRGLAAYGDPEQAESVINAEINASDAIAIGPIAAVMPTYTVTGKEVFRTADIGWVYLRTVANKRMFITVSKSYYVHLVTSDNKGHDIPITKEADANAAIQMIAEKYPDKAIGYTDEARAKFDALRQGLAVEA